MIDVMPQGGFLIDCVQSKQSMSTTLVFCENANQVLANDEHHPLQSLVNMCQDRSAQIKECSSEMAGCQFTTGLVLEVDQ